MAYKIEFDPAARRELEKLDKSVSDRILKFLRVRVATLDDPRKIGERVQRPSASSGNIAQATTA
ncbi:MAG: type II toxin-antitoxin system RelE family toxin [Terriglobales bacterium]